MNAENNQTNEFITYDCEKFIWKQDTIHQFFQKSLSIGTETSNVIISF